jgi:hypothetical protein
MNRHGRVDGREYKYSLHRRIAQCGVVVWLKNTRLYVCHADEALRLCDCNVCTVCTALDVVYQDTHH